MAGEELLGSRPGTLTPLTGPGECRDCVVWQGQNSPGSGQLGKASIFPGECGVPTGQRRICRK